jgi:hypothetical protein
MIILITKLTCRNSKTLFRAGGRAPLGVGRHKGPAGLGSRRLERRGGLERWIGTHRTGYDRADIPHLRANSRYFLVFFVLINLDLNE